MRERTVEGVLIELCDMGEVKPRGYVVCKPDQNIGEGEERNVYCLRRSPEATTYSVEVKAEEFRGFIQKAIDNGSAEMTQEFHEDLDSEYDSDGGDIYYNWFWRYLRFHGYAEIKLNLAEGVPRLKIKSLGKAKWTNWE